MPAYRPLVLLPSAARVWPDTIDRMPGRSIRSVPLNRLRGSKVRLAPSVSVGRRARLSAGVEHEGHCAACSLQCVGEASRGRAPDHGSAAFAQALGSERRETIEIVHSAMTPPAPAAPASRSRMLKWREGAEHERPRQALSLSRRPRRSRCLGRRPERPARRQQRVGYRPAAVRPASVTRLVSRVCPALPRFPRLLTWVRVDPLSAGMRSSWCVRTCVPTSAETPIAGGSGAGVTGYASSTGTERVVERRRTVALAHHYREAESLSIREIRTVSGGRRRRSRRTSTTRRGRRRGRSRLATLACAGAAAPTPSRATARAMPTRNARAVIPARSGLL